MFISVLPARSKSVEGSAWKSMQFEPTSLLIVIDIIDIIVVILIIVIFVIPDELFADIQRRFLIGAETLQSWVNVMHNNN